MPKVRREKAAGPLRHNPLADQIIEEEDRIGLRKTPRVKVRRGSKVLNEDGPDVLPASVARKVLEVAQKQKADEEDDFDGLQDDGVLATGDGDIEVEEEEVDVEVDEDGFVITEGATEEEERALALFLPGKGAQQAGPTLADVILQKIQEHEARKDGAVAAEQEEDGPTLSPKVLEVYGEIGKWLKHYKSGKLPKAFKVIPSLTNWEEVLSLTGPLNWSPAAMYEAVNIFASSLNPRMAQRFFNLVLLPAVRQNIAQYKRLNFHYYRSMRKALFKPAAFFKGIVLPMAQENCTLREATILSSVLSKASIPPMHSAAALVRLCLMNPWYGTTSVIIAALVNKKYALPVRVVDCMVSHFCSFAREERALPLVWHRALLLFVQRYKMDLTEQHHQRLKELLRVHLHESVGLEVRRELLAARSEVPGETASTAAMEVG